MEKQSRLKDVGEKLLYDHDAVVDEDAFALIYAQLHSLTAS